MVTRHERLSPLVREMPAAPEEITGGPHLGGIDRALRQHAATQQNGDLLGVEIVVFGLAPVDRFHIQRVPNVAPARRDGVEVVQFSKPGTYLVICARKNYFFNPTTKQFEMFSFVKVLPGNKK
jgi:hypothetical protein